MHKNTIIRNELFNILNITGSGINVYNSRLRDLPDTKLPALSIYINTENAIKVPDEHGYIREPQVIIVCAVKGLDRTHTLSTGEKYVDEKLDDLYEFIENQLLTPIQTLNKQLYRFNFEGVSNITVENLGDNGIKLVSYTNWRARYNQEI